MAKIVVTNLNDTGAGSLRAAIEQANANADADKIVFDKSLVGASDKSIYLGSTLTITQGTVTIDGDLDGDGDPDITISGDTGNDGPDQADVGILLHVDVGATANVRSLVFADGYAKGADATNAGQAGEDAIAGIRNDGTLTITDSIIRDNLARAGASGGPLFDLDGRSQDGASAFGSVFNRGSLTMTDSLLLNNRADGAAAAYGYNFGGDGGDGVAGIYSGGASSLLVLNRTMSQGSSSNGGDGGNAYNWGGDGGDAVSALLLNDGTASGILGSNGGGGAAGDKGLADPNFGGADGQSGQNTSTIFRSGDHSGLDFQHDSSAHRFGTYGADNATVANGGTYFGLQGNDIIDNSAGYGQVFGGSGNDTITTRGNGAKAYGGSGNDTIVNTYTFYATMDGGSGIDTLDVSGDTGSVTFDMTSGILTSGWGTATNFENFIGVDDKNFQDTVFGTGAKNVIEGRGGGDILFGGSGNDVLRGGGQADRLSGDDDNDRLFGDGGGDTINGGRGNDKAFGGTGNDTISGNSGKDKLFGDDGKDRIDGGSGNDRIEGGKGDDKIASGGGNDILIFGKRDGTDLVKDYVDGKDRFDLKAFGFSSKAQALSHFYEIGGKNNDVVGFHANGTDIKIKGADLKDIDAHDIII